MVFVRAWSDAGRRTLKQSVRREVGRMSERMRAVDFAAFLEQLLAAYPVVPLHVVLDNANIHTAKLTGIWCVAHPTAELCFLPKYARHRENPVETGWWRLKQQVLANRLYSDLEQLVAAGHAFFGRFTTEAALQLAACEKSATLPHCYLEHHTLSETGLRMSKCPIAALVTIASLVAGGCGSDSAPTPPLPLETFTTTTHQTGSLLILQNRTSTATVQIGLDTAWGGSVVEVSLNGTNYVNEHDHGRAVQPALYDGNAQYDDCAACSGVWGWDPVLAGDKYDHGTPTITHSVTASSLYTKAQPLEWDPDNKGGGAGAPVMGDVIVEQTVGSVSGHAQAFRLHYRITHLGSDVHANAPQELPAIYVNADYNQFVYYGGTAPWTNAAVTLTQLQPLGQSGSLLYAPEHWGAYVNAQNVGLTIYVPSQYGYVAGGEFAGPSGPTGDGTNYFAPFTVATIGPHLMLEGNIYLIAGDYTAARQIIYELHQSSPGAPDIFPPFGSTDAPAAGVTVGGVTTVSGWAFDDGSVAKVEIMIDGVVDGMASYGLPRPDVAAAFPHAPTNVGYSYSWNTAKYGNGPHVLNVKVTDGSGNVAVFPNVAVTVGN